MAFNSNFINEDLPYYFTDFPSYDEVKQTLEPYVKENGCFLLRNSLKTQGRVSISVTHQKQIRHMNIIQNKQKYYLQDQGFKSVADLVKYYSKHDVPNNERIQHIRLLHPILKDTKKGPLRSTHKTHPIPGEKKNTWLRRATSEDPSSRPPVPPPRLPEWADLVPPSEESGKAEVQYDYATNLDVSRVPQLISEIDRMERIEVCKCGLLVKESRLPKQWTVHRSTEKPTMGRLFFVSPQNESLWDLPEHIVELLSQEQLQTLEKLEQDAIENEGAI